MPNEGSSFLGERCSTSFGGCKIRPKTGASETLPTADDYVPTLFFVFFSRWWKPLRKRNSDMLGFPAYRYVLLLLLWYTGRVSCVSPPGYARVFSGPRFDSSVCKHLFQASRARTIISLFFFFFFFFLYILKASTRGEVGKTIARMLWILTRKFIFFFFYILTILRGYKRLPWPQHTRARARRGRQ